MMSCMRSAIIVSNVLEYETVSACLNWFCIYGWQTWLYLYSLKSCAFKIFLFLFCCLQGNKNRNTYHFKIWILGAEFRSWISNCLPFFSTPMASSSKQKEVITSSTNVKDSNAIRLTPSVRTEWDLCALVSWLHQRFQPIQFLSAWPSEGFIHLCRI